MVDLEIGKEITCRCIDCGFVWKDNYSEIPDDLPQCGKCQSQDIEIN